MSFHPYHWGSHPNFEKKEREREREIKSSLFYKFHLYRTRSVAPKVIQGPPILFTTPKTLFFSKGLSVLNRGKTKSSEEKSAYTFKM